MKVNRYRKKPVEVEAVWFDGINGAAVSEWCGGQIATIDTLGVPRTIAIPTLEGEMLANLGDYIIRGVEGEFYPCRADIFHQTYEEVKP